MARADDLKKLIDSKRRRLQKLKEQEAIYGISADPNIPLQIEDLEAELEKLQIELAALKTEDTERTVSTRPRPGSSSFRQVKMKNLEERLADLIADYEAANDQLSNALSEVERTRLQRQLDALEGQIEQVERELNALQ